ncbi:hypothetical protein D3C73_552230 [compost metagenome]
MNNLAGANLRRFLERDRLLKPRGGNHAGTILVLVAFGTFNRVPHTVDQPDIDLQPFCHLDLHRIVRHKFRLCRHDGFTCRALRKLINRSYPVSLARNVRQDDRFHEAFDEC